ncbi:hypothetical protein DSO57_1001618 [Entomophthora muscae]|uniref:Uncharacterized protein n=1 Tax=Entomophthora muscae TaxID=34485 RepID=A0ACC2S007_9FUNG|nr:hypothetical protein DSO57_1001618 [Entomophthora muscae]
MRSTWLSLLVLGLFACFTFAFEKIDFEIFELQDELRKQEGPESNLYKLLGVSTGDSVKKITRAYRKLSLEVHPDKDSSDKATKKFALLSNAHKVLKEKYARERYDFFLKNGFPVWRGTDYMYHRHRPGVLFAILFVLIVGSGTQYLVQQISYVRTKDRIAYVIEEYSKTLNLQRCPKAATTSYP